MTQNDQTIIVRFRYENLKNEVHMEYHDEVNILIVKYGGAAALGFAVLYAVYKPLYDEEVLALDQITKSDFTEEIAVMDEERDRLYRGFKTSLKGYLDHNDHDKRIMARKLVKILDHYGDVTRKSLDGETAAIKDIVRELLKSENYSLLVGLQLDQWMRDLEKANLNLEQLMMKRYDEAAKRAKLHMREVRMEVDKAFRAILDLLESLVRVQGPATDKAFIDELNAVSTRYKDILAQETGRRHPVKDISTGDDIVVETIEAQAYTGKPVIPIPVIYRRGDEKRPTVELVFTHDFTVVYKNNVEVGMAEVTIQGKGNYKGKITALFNIARI
jgi:hypothetical protein